MRLWFRWVFPAWNFIPSFLHSALYDENDGKRMLKALHERAPKVQEIVTQMRIFGFVMTTGEPRGMFSFRCKPWVTCGRRSGGCDDYALLYATVLRYPRARVQFLYTTSFKGGSCLLVVYSFGGISWLLSGPDILEDVFESRKGKLLMRYYGEDTKDSFLF